MATYGIYHNGQWYDDIYYDGHWIDQVYIGKELVWEKDNLPIGTWKNYRIRNGILYKHKSTVYIDVNTGIATNGIVHVLRYNEKSKTMDDAVNTYDDSGKARMCIAGITDKEVLYSYQYGSITIYRQYKDEAYTRYDRLSLTYRDGDINTTISTAASYVSDPSIIVDEDTRHTICKCSVNLKDNHTYRSASGPIYSVTRHPLEYDTSYKDYDVDPSSSSRYAIEREVTVSRKGGPSKYTYTVSVSSYSLITAAKDVLYSSVDKITIIGEAGNCVYLEMNSKVVCFTNGSIYDININAWGAVCYDYKAGVYYAVERFDKGIYKSTDGYNFTLWKRTAEGPASAHNRPERLVYLQGVGLLAESYYTLYVFDEMD